MPDIIRPLHTAITTTDGLQLPALLFEPVKPTKRAAIYLHGNGSSAVFYSVDDTRAMAAALTAAGIAYLALNNRGAHLIQKLDRTLPDGTIRRESYGVAYELIKECVMDINGAIAGLEALGYDEFYLIGKSTGANKICVYDHYVPGNKVSKYVMVAGGDDSGIYYNELGADLFKTALADARNAVDDGDGRAIVPARIADVMGYISQQSVLDMLDPDGDYNTFPFHDAFTSLGLSSRPLFGYYHGITTPSLVIYGAEDEYCYGNVEGAVGLLRQHANPAAQTEYTIIPGTGHKFSGAYPQLARHVAEFLSAG